MKDLIVISGAPGSGKSTLAALLKDELGSPYIDFGWIRELHLDREWTTANEDEERMSFENLTFILTNYIAHGYRNVIVTDLKDFRVREIPQHFENNDYLIISLTVESDAELRKRLVERNSGFKDVERAIAWNRELKNRKTLPGEFKIDNSHNSPAETLTKILTLV